MNTKSTQLIRLYFFICDDQNSDLWTTCLRFSPNDSPAFTDQELVCAYLFALLEGHRSSVKSAYRFIVDYWKSWFPKIPPYNSFVNRLADLFQALVGRLIASIPSTQSHILLLDACPITVSKGYRKPSNSWVSKGYCAAKYYYGVKLHCLAEWRSGKLALPPMIGYTDPPVHDLTAVKSQLMDLKSTENLLLIADKAYIDAEFKAILAQHGGCLLHPQKDIKGKSECLKQFDQAANHQWNRFLASLRQPIEGFFSWMASKWNYQNASKVCSKKGLEVHLFAKLAAAICSIIPYFNP